MGKANAVEESNDVLNKEQQKTWDRLKYGVPIRYVVGTQTFFGNDWGNVFGFNVPYNYDEIKILLNGKELEQVEYKVSDSTVHLSHSPSSNDAIEMLFIQTKLQ